MTIYVGKNGVQSGPYSFGQVVSYLDSGQLLESDWCWVAGEKDWLPVRSLIEKLYNAEIYVARNNVQLGPFSHRRVVSDLARGELADNDLGWTAGEADWAPLRALLSKIETSHAVRLEGAALSETAADASEANHAAQLSSQGHGVQFAVPAASQVRGEVAGAFAGIEKHAGPALNVVQEKPGTAVSKTETVTQEFARENFASREPDSSTAGLPESATVAAASYAPAATAPTSTHSDPSAAVAAQGKPTIRQGNQPVVVSNIKSQTAAVLLAAFFGGLGVHRFYLGRKISGILYLVFFWTMIPALIAVIETVVIAFTSQVKWAEKYNDGVLSDPVHIIVTLFVALPVLLFVFVMLVTTLLGALSLVAHSNGM